MSRLSLSPFAAPLRRAEAEIDRRAAAQRDAQRVVTSIKLDIMLHRSPPQRARARAAELKAAEDALWEASMRWLKSCATKDALRAQQARWHDGR